MTDYPTDFDALLEHHRATEQAYLAARRKHDALVAALRGLQQDMANYPSFDEGYQIGLWAEELATLLARHAEREP